MLLLLLFANSVLLALLVVVGSMSVVGTGGCGGDGVANTLGDSGVTYVGIVVVVFVVVFADAVAVVSVS